METSKYYKYPSTFHLPWSPHNKRDDKKWKTTGAFYGKEVIVTEKMDGENTTLYRDHIHARSINSSNHPSRTWVKGLHGKIKANIPEGMRICGENLYAVHSIEYTDLEDYFQVFSIWVDDLCLGWEDTEAYCELLGLTTVDPISLACPWNEVNELHYRTMSEDWSGYLGRESEGFVARLNESFYLRDWDTSIAKWVRKGHVQTDDHWLNQEMKVNGLRHGNG